VVSFAQFSASSGSVSEESTTVTPQWLTTWVRELQAHAQSGLAYTQDPYDRERYAAIRRLAAEIAAHHTNTPAEVIHDLFAAEAGYATPKVDVPVGSMQAKRRAWPSSGRCWRNLAML
jgi:hypothetical protein